MTATTTARAGSPLLAHAATIFATGLGSGYSPIVPGTAGSLVGLVLFWPLHLLPFAWQVALIAACFLLGVAASGHVARRVGLEDPSIVVVDEVVGMWVTLAFLPLNPITAVAGFVLFRVLDVFKPFPARQLEDLPGGWGVMSDDLMAGIYGNLLLRIAFVVW
jgi:phosphatidylglycerophosphatase A